MREFDPGRFVFGDPYRGGRCEANGIMKTESAILESPHAIRNFSGTVCGPTRCEFQEETSFLQAGDVISLCIFVVKNADPTHRRPLSGGGWSSVAFLEEIEITA